MPETLLNDLRKIALFEGMENDTLQPLGRLCRRITVPAGKTVVSAQDHTKDVYFLIEGKVRVINYSADGKAVILLDIASGGFFGEMAAIDGEIRSASVETLEDCTMLLLPETDFLLLLHDEPTITHIFLRHFVRELRKMSQRVFEFRTMAVQNRIHADLLRLAKSTGATTGTVSLAPAPTLAEIADRVSTHREAVSREISRMSKAGLLKRSKDRLDIVDLDELDRLVRDATGD
jgi:CRP/FNR family cyclic AMP-dependent transcriptional regulator